MGGFTTLTGIETFDLLMTTNQYGGAGENMQGDDLFVIFRGRDNTGRLLLVDSAKIIECLSKEYIKLINYIGSGAYTVSLEESNPKKNDLILKENFGYSKSYYHVIKFTVSETFKSAAVSVAINMDGTNFISTSFVSDEHPRRSPPSFAMIK
ncbi:hypothetical protein H0S68_25450 (plasmid) [Serratia sp. AXJ-M]|uniref:hypothetical protein n=1 Tax=Serratia sp. AXJ-M TaxID=2754727 RepID=UPI00397E8A65